MADLDPMRMSFAARERYMGRRPADELGSLAGPGPAAWTVAADLDEALAPPALTQEQLDAVAALAEAGAVDLRRRYPEELPVGARASFVPSVPLTPEQEVQRDATLVEVEARVDAEVRRFYAAVPGAPRYR